MTLKIDATTSTGGNFALNGKKIIATTTSTPLDLYPNMNLRCEKAVVGTAGKVSEFPFAVVSYSIAPNATILMSNNVSSLTDVGVGRVTINLATPMEDNKCCVVGTAQYSATYAGQIVKATTITTSAVSIDVTNASFSVSDSPKVNVIIHND